MNKKVYRIVQTLLVLVFVLSTVVGVTYAWRSFNQEAENKIKIQQDIPVELLKLRKEQDGTKTEIPISGTIFHLFKEDGEQIGDTYTTDNEGKISVKLPEGKYYFEEWFPADGYDFDRDEKYELPITRYEFEVSEKILEENEEKPIQVIVYNVPIEGDLVLQKLVKNADGSKLTEEQQNKEFIFTVTFSDGKEYSYKLDGKGDPITIASGGTLKLKHNQKAVFENIPDGVEYDISEKIESGYKIQANGHHGNITEYGVSAVFNNIFSEETEKTGSLRITKEVRREPELTKEDKETEFVFKVIFDTEGTFKYRICDANGKTLDTKELKSGETIKLKHGQTAVFDEVPAGVQYTITEQKAEGYQALTESFDGVIIADVEEDEDTDDLDTSDKTEDSQKEESSDQKDQPDETPASEETKAEEAEGDPLKKEEQIEGVLTYSDEDVTTEEKLVRFINVPETTEETEGSLIIRKTIAGEMPEEDKDLQFEFEISYSWMEDAKPEDGKLPEGLPTEFKLKAGETFELKNLPHGLIYHIKEKKDESGYAMGYLPVIDTVNGVIYGGYTSEAVFVNQVPEKDELYTLKVTKLVPGEVSAGDEGKKFHFTAVIGGVKHEFDLADGETKEFKDIPKGMLCEIIEDDYSGEGYYQSLMNGLVTIEEDTYVFVINTFRGKIMRKISGEKTWEMNGADSKHIPKKIRLLLKQGDILVQEKTVTADKNGKWKYEFEVPKYDNNGVEIKYTIEEEPVSGFVASYDGYNIKNTYVEPVEIDPPVLEKAIEGNNAPKSQFEFWFCGEEGAPMPDGSIGNVKVLTLDESGQVELGMIKYNEPGVYVYKVVERDKGADRWVYDDAIYTYTVTVTLEDGKLHAKNQLQRNEKVVDKLMFKNRYKSEDDTENDKNVTISGKKIWKHGSNPEKDRPDSICVYVYADGKLVKQRLVTEADYWKYSFELPKYTADGKEIEYTIGEEKVEGYSSTTQDYNLINTYIEPDGSGNGSGNGSGDGTDNDDPSGKGDDDGSGNGSANGGGSGSGSSGTGSNPNINVNKPAADTGDHTPILLYLLLAAGSGLALIILAVLRRKKEEEEDK